MNRLDGCRLVHGRTRKIRLSGSVDDATLHALLQALKDHGEEFGFFDERYPSPSDPGAYFSYSPSEAAGKWRMTLGNHGWTGGIYEIDDDTVCRQLRDLVADKLIRSIEIDHVYFFSRKPAETASSNGSMNKKLMRIHRKAAAAGPQ